MGKTQESLETQLSAATRGTAIVTAHAPGCVEVLGPDSLDLLHRISTNDLQGLSPGSATRTILLDAKGRIVDLVTVGVQERRIILLCSPGGETKLMEWIEKFIITEDVRTKTISDYFTIIKLVGSQTLSTVFSLMDASFSPHSLAEKADDQGTLVAIASGWKMGEEVVLLVEERGRGESGMQINERLKGLGAVEMQERAWELYRISQGIPRAGAEISEEYNPYDVGLVDFVSYTKGCYVGQEVIARLDTYQKARRTLFSLRLSERPTGSSLPIRLRKGDAEAGVCTSLSDSPYRGEHLGLAVLRADLVSEGDMLSVEGSTALCRVSSIPMEIESG
jgi:folate-binding protein YgfZ